MTSIPPFLEWRGSRATKPPSFAARLPQFIAAPADRNGRLASISALFIGCGGVGRQAALQLVRLGIRRVLLADPKSYKPESLITQAVLPAEVGSPKAQATARLCKQLNPALEVFYFNGPVQGLQGADLGEISFGVVATDNLAAEVAAGHLFTELGRPLFHASVHGASLTAQVRCFGNESPTSPCPACLFGEEEWRLFHEAALFSCEGASRSGVAVPAPEGPPTMAPGCLCALAADLCVTLALRHTLGLGASVLNTLHSFNGYTARTLQTPLARNPACPFGHQPLTRFVAPRKLGDCSLTELARIAGGHPEEFTVQVAGLVWLEAALCGCGAPCRIRRFVAGTTTRRGRCRECGEVQRASSVFTHSTVSSLLLGAAAETSLRRLGAPAPRWVQVSGQNHRAVFVDADRTNPESE